MKYLLVFAVVMVAFYLWRHNRQAEAQERRERRAAQRPAAPPGPPIAMVACRACGTHLPQSEAVPGRLGSYCSTEHLQRLEGPHG
jgi:uncharacterized protein